jgi:hypothetical protein
VIAMKELDVYRHDPAKDPAGERLSTHYLAVLALERWQTMRAGATDLLAWASAPCWIVAAWPGLLPRAARALVLGLWAVLVAIFLGAVVAERRWRRRARCHAGPGLGRR